MKLSFKQIGLAFIAATTLTLTACDALKQAATNVLIDSVISNADVANGLKEALRLGVFNGVDKLSVKGGFTNSAYKILLPEEARKITEKLKVIPGFTKVEDVLVEKLNAGAEDAATKAKPIFLNAITKMSFQDAMGILMGEKNAATSFLKRTTSDDLYKEFNPVIISSLDKYDARKYWSDAVNVYNKMPFVQKANADLGDYVTKEALKGLFSMVEEKERGIRGDKTQRTSDLLQKVFAKQDAK
jgi:hypothetical protein